MRSNENPLEQVDTNRSDNFDMLSSSEHGGEHGGEPLSRRQTNSERLETYESRLSGLDYSHTYSNDDRTKKGIKQEGKSGKSTLQKFKGAFRRFFDVRSRGESHENVKSKSTSKPSSEDAEHQI